MDFGREAASGSSEGFIVLSSSCACRTVMRPHHCAIHKMDRPIELTFQVSKALKLRPDLPPKAFCSPAAEPAGDGRPLAETLWNITPRRTCSENPEGATDDGSMFQIRTPETN
jgi:hypothetical protein